MLRQPGAAPLLREPRHRKTQRRGVSTPVRLLPDDRSCAKCLPVDVTLPRYKWNHDRLKDEAQTVARFACPPNREVVWASEIICKTTASATRSPTRSFLRARGRVSWALILRALCEERL